ncbi:MAG: M48 family metallopeptidase, partial [Spirochaetota bacterium]
GVGKPFIILNSSMIDHLSDAELMAVIGHELGHILSGHVLYKTLLFLLMNISLMLVNIPIGTLALGAILAALREWDRKSELSADRAGLLTVQDVNDSYTVLMKLAGGSHIGQMDIEEFFKQAHEYESGGDILDSVYKILNLLGQSHPFPVLRLNELKIWVDSGNYEKILSGDYRKRQDKEDDIMKEFQRAASQYQEDLSKSQDPLAESFVKLSRVVDEAGKQAGRQVEDLMKGLFGGGPKKED